MPVAASHAAGRGLVRYQRLRVLFALVVREMSTKFGRSYGGYFWAIAQPLGGIALLNLVFSVMVRHPALGTNFPLFYATGIIPFFFFTGVSSTVSSAVATNRGLLRYPVVSPLDTIFGKFIIEFVTMLIVFVLLTGGIIFFYQLPVMLDPLSAFLGFTLAGLLGLGVGTINCVLFGLFPTWKHIWSVITKPLFVISGVFFIVESAPDALRHMIVYNPIVQAIALVRKGFYGSYDPYYVSYPYVLGIALGLFTVGAYLLRRYEGWLLDN
jgi:capsular polysaccharide transport system permease protein